MVKKKYNTKSSDAFGVTTGRLSMVRVGLALSFFVFTVAVVVAGCLRRLTYSRWFAFCLNLSLKQKKSGKN